MKENHIPQENEEFQRLWTTSDVMEFTGWKSGYVSRLCVNGTLPHIPGKPHKFVPSEVKQALIEMQVGGQYGRRKAKKTTPKSITTVKQ